MASRTKRWWMELRRRVRLSSDETEGAWPSIPAGVWLNPSDSDFSTYEAAPLALSWKKTANGETSEWQVKTRVKLQELLGTTPLVVQKAPPILGETGTINGSLKRQTFYLPYGPRRHIPVTVVWDQDKSSEKKPVMLCLQGHTSGAHISWGEARLPADLHRIDNGGDYAIQAVRNGHVAICIEQIAFGERREQGLHHRWEHPCVDASNRALLLGRTLLGDRVSDVMAVVGWLNTAPSDLPGFDVGRIRAMGNSAGGEVALFVAALDTRIEGVIASGCVGDWRKTSGRRKTCPDTVIPGVLKWIEYSDILALCAPRPLLVVSGMKDHIYPFHFAAECVEDARPAYAALSASGLLRAVAGPAGHRFYPETAWYAFLQLLDLSAS